jgi:hypothetical protein
LTTLVDDSRLAALVFTSVFALGLGDSGTTALQRQHRGGLEAERSANLSDGRIRAGLRAGEDSAARARGRGPTATIDADFKPTYYRLPV